MLTDELDAEMKRRSNIKNVVLFGIEVQFASQKVFKSLLNVYPLGSRLRTTNSVRLKRHVTL